MAALGPTGSLLHGITPTPARRHRTAGPTARQANTSRPQCMPAAIPRVTATCLLHPGFVRKHAPRETCQAICHCNVPTSPRLGANACPQ